MFLPCIGQVPASNRGQGTGFSDRLFLVFLNNVTNARVMRPLPSMPISVYNLLITNHLTFHIPSDWQHHNNEQSRPWEADSSSPSQISRSVWNTKFHDRIHKNLQAVPILSQMNPFHTLPSCFLKLNFNSFVTLFSGEQVIISSQSISLSFSTMTVCKIVTKKFSDVLSILKVT
jgi:hypothetical protein